MPGTIHAVLLLVLPVAVLIALAVMRRRIPTLQQLVIAVVLTASGMAGASMSNQHMCREGAPLTQWLIPGPFLLLALLFVHSPVRRRVLGAAVFLGMIGLSCQFTNLVHEPGWTGNPHWDGGVSGRLRSVRDEALEFASESENPSVVLPANWLRELPIWPELEERYGDLEPVRRELHETWHSWLTGLYRYSNVPQDYWYPGGPLARAMTRLELRDRATR